MFGQQRPGKLGKLGFLDLGHLERNDLAQLALVDLGHLERNDLAQLALVDLGQLERNDLAQLALVDLGQLELGELGPDNELGTTGSFVPMVLALEEHWKRQLGWKPTWQQALPWPFSPWHLVDPPLDLCQSLLPFPCHRLFP
jgi:hypothetical protein